MYSLSQREKLCWSRWLNCDLSTFDQTGLHRLPNPNLDDRGTIIVLSTYRNTFISIPEQTFTHFEGILAPLSDNHLVALTDIINALGANISHCGYILAQACAEREHFKPRTDTNIHLLARNELHLLKPLEAACHPVEWEHSSISYDADNNFGYFVDQSVVAAAHYLVFQDELASIGVLTHPDYRNRGFSSAAASAAMQHALDHGYGIHYQTLLENRPSITLAQKLGCRFFGLTIRLLLEKGP